MKLPALFFLVAIACSAAEPSEPAPISTSVEELKTMLSTPLTRAELERKFGCSWNASENTWGTLMYKCESGGYAAFFFKGPHITGASLSGQEIAGVPPKGYQITPMFDSEKKEYTPSLNGDVFRDLAQFQKLIEKLPAGSIVEWQGSCLVQTELETIENLRKMRTAAEAVGIILVRYPAG